MAAVPFDVAITAGGSGGATQSGTISASAALLIAFIYVQSTTAPTSVTWNGVEMDLVGSQNNGNGSASMHCYKLKNPDTGTHNFAFSTGGTFSRGQLLSYTDAGDVDDSSSGAAGGGSLSGTVTTTDPDSWPVMGVGHTGNTAPTAGSGTTRRSDMGGSPAQAGFDSGSTITTPGSTSLNANYNFGELNVYFIVSVTPVAAVPSERSAEATGQQQDDDERAAEAHGLDQAQSERSVEALGAQLSDAERDAEAHGIDQESSDRNAEADGGIFVNDERAAQASGTDSDTSDRAAEGTGAFIESDARTAEAHGVDTEQSEREAEATGADSASSDRAAEAIAQAARIDSPVMRKSISIKAYTRSGTFIREIEDADFSGFMKVINQGLGDCIITIGRKFDDIGTDFVEGNHIEIWLTDKETVAMQFGPLRSRRIYAGEVKLVEPMIEGAEEQVQITLQGYGILLGLDVLKSTAQTSLYTRTTGGVGTTDTPEAVDIGSVVQGILDRYIAETVNPRIGYTAASIPTVGENMTYTFEQRTYREAIEKCLATAPFGHYWYLDENGLFTFRQIGTTPTHKFVFGKHFSGVRVARSLEKVRNFMLIWNGLPTGGGGLYKKYENTGSILKYGRRIERLTDAGIGSEATMDLIGAKFLAESSEIEVKFIFTVMDNQGSDVFGYDIESINPGDTCTVFNFNSSISELLRENMIITEVEYTPQRARITIEPIRISIADISERLKKQISEQATQGIIESYS